MVAGDDRVKTEGQRTVEDGGELDLLVARHARVGGATGGVLGHEPLDHLVAELRREIPDVVGDPEDVGHPSSIAGVLTGAATTGSSTQGFRGQGQS